MANDRVANDRVANDRVANDDRNPNRVDGDMWGRLVHRVPVHLGNERAGIGKDERAENVGNVAEATRIPVAVHMAHVAHVAHAANKSLIFS